MNVDKMVEGGPGQLHVNSPAKIRSKKKRRGTPLEVAYTKKKPNIGNVYRMIQGNKQRRDSNGRFASGGGVSAQNGAPQDEFKLRGDEGYRANEDARARARRERQIRARKKTLHRLAIYGGLAAAAERLHDVRPNPVGQLDDSKGTFELRIGFGERNRGLRSYLREPGYRSRVGGRTPIVGNSKWRVEMDNRDAIARAVYLIGPNPLGRFRFNKQDSKAVEGERDRKKKSKRFPHGRSIKSPKVYEALRRAGYDKSAAAAISNAQRNRQRISKAVLADIQDGIIIKADRDFVAGLLADIGARGLDVAAGDPRLSDETAIIKHPGHADQSVHSIRHGADRGRKTVGRKAANRNRKNRQGHDPMGRYTSRSRNRNRERIKIGAGSLAAGIALTTLANQHSNIKQLRQNLANERQMNQTFAEIIRNQEWDPAHPANRKKRVPRKPKRPKGQK